LLSHPDYYRYRAEVLSFLEEYEGGAGPKANGAAVAEVERAA
jgi:nitrate/nitrite transport system ATP-binding protein